MDIEEDQLRPYMMSISINEKYLGVVTGPQYGQFGGALTIYDIDNKKHMFTNRNIVEKHGLISITFDDKDENIVWLGTYIYGEKTLSLEHEEAKLVKYDIAKNKIIFSVTPINGVPSIRNIIKLGEYVYCLVNNEVVKVDANNGVFINKSKRTDINEICLMGNDIIGISNNEIFKIDNETLSSESIMSNFSLLNNLRYDNKTNTIFVFEGYNLLKVKK